MRFLIVTAALCSLTLTAVAAETPPAPARKIDFTTVLLDADGNPFSECVRADEASPTKCAEKIEVTLGYLARGALNLRHRGDENLKLEELVQRGQLARFVYKSPAAELDSDEVTLIKKAIVAVPTLQTTMVEAALRILDPTVVKDRPGR